MAQEAASTREDILGLEDVATIASMGLLASTFWNQGRWKEADSPRGLSIKVIIIKYILYTAFSTNQMSYQTNQINQIKSNQI
jgi:hypothetical protein